MSNPFRITTSRLRGPVTDEDHVLGSTRAPVTLVEYGDYQCQRSAAVHAMVQEVMWQRPTTVAFVYRHFPLTDLHPYAELAAETAEAAGARGHFWQMHDWLYGHQDQLKPLNLALAIDRIGLDVEHVGRSLNGRRYLSRVRRDFSSGVRSGVVETPAFFLNGVRYDGNHGLVDMLGAIDRAAIT